MMIVGDATTLSNTYGGHLSIMLLESPSMLLENI
jgi:hypothetical protein